MKLDAAIRNRWLLLGASLLALGWAWYSHSHTQPLNRGLAMIVIACFVTGFVLGRRRVREGLRWQKGPSTQTNWLRAVVALLPFIGLAFQPEIQHYPIPAVADRQGGSHSWTWLASDGRYFVEVDHGTGQAVKYEITKAEYDEVQRRGALLASTVILIFAYAAACFAWFMLAWPPAAPRATAS